MAKLQLPKLVMRVRFPLPAPNKNGRPHGRPFLFGSPVIRLSTRRKFVGVGEAANLHAPHGSAPQLRLLLFKLSQFAPRANWGFRFPFKEIRFRFRRRRRANPRLCLQFLSFSISVIAVPSAQGISAPRIFAYVGASSTVGRRSSSMPSRMSGPTPKKTGCGPLSG